MEIKYIGSILIVGICTCFGFRLAAGDRAEEKTLKNLLHILRWLRRELRFHMTPLPDLFLESARQAKGGLSDVFRSFSRELEKRTYPDAESCVATVLSTDTRLSPRVKMILKVLGSSLGHFDLDGQLEGIQEAEALCQNTLDAFCANQENRRKSYRIIAACCGISLAILLF